MVRRHRRRSAEPRRHRGRTGHGFTLIEILVALAILAVALAAGMRAVAQAADSATLLKQRTLALWVAQNRLAAAQLAPVLPATGESNGAAEQAGTGFVWRETVAATPNPAFRRIDIVVAAPDQPDYALAHIAGYLGVPPPR
jgi:general secretion pathway protein I